MKSSLRTPLGAALHRPYHSTNSPNAYPDLGNLVSDIAGISLGEVSSLFSCMHSHKLWLALFLTPDTVPYDKTYAATTPPRVIETLPLTISPRVIEAVSLSR